jgi:hypothetical protein
MTLRRRSQVSINYLLTPHEYWLWRCQLISIAALAGTLTRNRRRLPPFPITKATKGSEQFTNYFNTGRKFSKATHKCTQLDILSFPVSIIACKMSAKRRYRMFRLPKYSKEHWRINRLGRLLQVSGNILLTNRHDESLMIGRCDGSRRRSGSCGYLMTD